MEVGFPVFAQDVKQSSVGKLSWKEKKVISWLNSSIMLHFVDGLQVLFWLSYVRHGVLE